MTFQQMTTHLLLATGDSFNKYELQTAKAWGKAKFRMPEEINAYCNKMPSEAEIQDFYKSFFNFDGVTV